MKPLYSKEEFEKAKNTDLLSVECYHCGKKFQVIKRRIQSALAGRRCDVVKYCNLICVGLSKNKCIEIKCDLCGKITIKQSAEVKRNTLHFCNKSCAATYKNTHKTKGFRRSKLEIWIESQLRQKYPELFVDYNNNEVIGSELDIYIPSLNFGVELNGLFHYEPIFGPEKLARTKNNDNRKFQACLEKGIELCIMDVTQMTYFKPEKANKYLNIICEIIDKKSSVVDIV